MKDLHVPRGPVYLLCASMLLSAAPARATDSLKTQGHEIVAGIVGVGVAAGVGLGVGIYFALHPTIKGCVSTDPDGLQIRDEKDQTMYGLTGATTALKPGEVVKVRGRKKSAKGKSPATIFRVDSVKKTYGACSATPAP